MNFLRIDLISYFLPDMAQLKVWPRFYKDIHSEKIDLMTKCLT